MTATDVEVWESDPEPSPSEVDDAWSDWDRRGAKQFRQPHFLQPRVRSTLERDLPDVHAALLATGAARVDPMDRLPAAIADRAAQPGDDRFVSVTARRTTLEHVLAACADKEEGLRVRRGRTATGLTARQQDAVPRVTGVRTRSGETPADLVVDAMGRSSPLPDWLAEIGAGPVEEEKEDSGFAYYTRFFCSRDGEVPEPHTITLLTPVGSFSILTLPSDRDTWSVTLFAATGDRPLKAFRHLDRWEAVVRACPLHAHWLDGEPISDIVVMAGVLDRRRRLSDRGQPVATGIVLVGDSWACTNPSLARGLALGLDHAARLRDTVRSHADDPDELAAAWDDLTESTFTPWYQATIAIDRARLAEMRAHREGEEPLPPPDEAAAIRSRLGLAASRDATAFRALMEIVGCLTLPAGVFDSRLIATIEATTQPGGRALSSPVPTDPSCWPS